MTGADLAIVLYLVAIVSLLLDRRPPPRLGRLGEFRCESGNRD